MISVYPCLINTVMRLLLIATLVNSTFIFPISTSLLQKGSRYSDVCTHKHSLHRDNSATGTEVALGRQHHQAKLEPLV